MPRNRLLALALIIAIGGLAALEGRRANAIPAFARKYQLSCSTCHAPFPRLKPFGEEFAGRGFRMEDRSKEPTRATYDVGDPLLMLSRELPLAVRIEGYASWKDDGASRTEFEWPWAAKLLSGGPITKNVSYYFYGILEQGESIKLEDTFIQFNSVFNLPIDVLAGQFQVSDPLFKREPRLERNDYSIFRLAVGEVPTNLTYDRGIVLTWHAPAAIDVVGQVVNGNGIDPARDDNFDDNSLKHYSLRVVRWFGPVRAGIFGHRGRTGPEGGFKDAITYLGPDLVIDLGDKAQLDLEYLRRTDDDPFLDGRSGSDLVSKGGLRSFIASPRAWTAVGWSACSTTTWIPTPRRPAPRTPQ